MNATDEEDQFDPGEATTVPDSDWIRAQASGLPQIAFAGVTDRGLVRERNEDQYLVARLTKSLEVIASSLPPAEHAPVAGREGYVLLVADGIGGRAGGARASALAVQGAETYLLEAAKWFFWLDDPDEHVRLRLVSEALERLDRAIIAEGQADPALAGMGTTLTAASIIGADVFIVHVGDSRAYILHGGSLKQLTTDHTLTQAMIDEGIISQEHARHHRLQGILTNALGGKPGVTPQIVKYRAQRGDRLLLCTDGLTSLVPDDRIAELLADYPEPRPACQALLEAALAAGGLDNVTIVLAAIG
jgi:protein phosphatase